MPPILYGTAWKKEATGRLVSAAIEHGFRGFDTAGQPKHYDEAGVGAGVARSLGGRLDRADLYLQTKFSPAGGQDPTSIPFDPKASTTDQVSQSFTASLRNLQTTYVDCLVLHSPLASARRTLEVWRAMEAHVADGSVRSLGISNCYRLEQLEELHEAARIKPAVVQNRFYADTGYDRDIRGFCRRRRIVYQSFWTLTANPHLLAHGALTTLASKYQRTPAQVLFRYLTLRDVVPLTGTRSPVHMRDDLAIFEFELDDRELDAVDALL